MNFQKKISRVIWHPPTSETASDLQKYCCIHHQSFHWRLLKLKHWRLLKLKQTQEIADKLWACWIKAVAEMHIIKYNKSQANNHSMCP